VHVFEAFSQSLFLFFLQYKKPELSKKLVNFGNEHEQNSFHHILRQLHLVSVSHLTSKKVNTQIDSYCRVVIEVLNDRISSLWAFRNSEQKLLNVLLLSKDFLLAKTIFKDLNALYEKFLQGKSSYSCYFQFATLEFVSHSLRTSFNDMKDRIEAFMSHLMKQLISSELIKFYHHHKLFYSRRNDFKFIGNGCILTPEEQVDNSVLHKLLKKLTTEYYQKAIQQSHFLSVSPPNENEHVFLQSFFAFQQTLLPVFHVFLQQLSSIILENALSSFLNTILTSHQSMDEKGLHLFFQSLLYIQELVAEHRKYLQIQDQSIRLWDNLCPLIRAKEILEILKNEVYPSSPVTLASNLATKPSNNSDTGKITNQGSIVSEKEKRLWKKIVQQSSSKHSFRWVQEYLSWKKKQKGAVFVALQFDIDAL
jgi:hypothetical protein